MSSVEEGTGVPARTDDIWGGQGRGKVTKRRVIAGGALLGAAALGVGLYFGLRDGEGSQPRGGGTTLISGQADPSSEGCFGDKWGDRTLTARLRDPAMTPELCNDHCATGGYFYYGVQWGIECWCGAETVDLDKHGLGTCDYACEGDSTQICGGLYSFTAYTVGTTATTPTPTPPTSTPGTASSSCTGTASVRFTEEIAYFEGGGCATLSDMYAAQTGSGPLYILDATDSISTGGITGRWLLTTDLHVIGGSLLQVHGTTIGGDADVLRIESTSSSYNEIRGWGGSLSFMSTKVTSWDTSNGQEMEYVSNKGRSFINCVTQFDDTDLEWDCEGVSNKEYGECRMDIIDSVMGNMGWFDSESYGLTWKVRGMCKDLDSSTGFPINHDIFKDHNVYGDILNSEIYGMYYGHYTYGHQGGVWDNNLMHDNIQYGFDPHDDSDDLVISNNRVWNNGNHGIIASKRCNNVKIFNNEVYDGGEGAVGVFLHRSSDGAEVYGNYIHDMQDSGFAMMESYDAEIYDNTVENCKYGIRLSLGSGRNDVHDNDFSGIVEYGIYTYEGSDAPDVPGSNGRPSNNVFDSNAIAGAEYGVYLQDADTNTFSNNVFTGVQKFEFRDSTDTTWTLNTENGACLDGSADFASGSIAAC